MIPQHHKHIEERKALFKAVGLFALLLGVCALVLFWAAHSRDSEVAQKIRKTIGIKEPAPLITEAPLGPEPAVVTPPEPEPQPEPISPPEPEPEPIPTITFNELTKSRHLWPSSLELKTTKQVTIRYRDKNYGYMEFVENSNVQVQALKAPDEIYCSINGNFISLSTEETNFVEWFSNKYAERYILEAIPKGQAASQPIENPLDSAEGEANFWSQIRIWCHQNYETVSLEIGEDNLIFRWLPKEDAPIDFHMEAREIARKYLLLRADLGGTENYAACEIRHPTTNELLGASSIFIPRL